MITWVKPNTARNGNTILIINSFMGKLFDSSWKLDLMTLSFFQEKYCDVDIYHERTEALCADRAWR